MVSVSPLEKPLTVLALLLLGIAALFVLLGGAILVVPLSNNPLPATDIDAFIAAGRMILDGRGAMIHDPAANLAELQQFVSAKRPVIWNYPPHASAASALLLGWMSPELARATISLTTLLAAAAMADWLAGAQQATRSTRIALILAFMTAAPLALAFVAGQPAFLIGIAIFLCAVHAWRGQPLAALLVPVAAMKPHIGGPFLLAVFLLQPASRKPLFLGGLLTIALTVASEAFIGWGATQRFFEAISSASRTVADNAHYPSERLVTPMAAMSVLFKDNPAIGRIVALAMSLGALAMLLPALVRSGGRDPRLTLGLAAAVPLWTTPYLYEYDFGLQFACLIAALPALAGERRLAVYAIILAASLLSLVGPVVCILNNAFDLSYKHSVGLIVSMMLTAGVLLAAAGQKRQAGAEATAA